MKTTGAEVTIAILTAQQRRAQVQAYYAAMRAQDKEIMRMLEQSITSADAKGKAGTPNRHAATPPMQFKIEGNKAP